ncbi:MAG: hypothetical protein P3W93_003675 [Thermus sp.]|nr:hypothetical protein [Thermus sp.]
MQTTNALEEEVQLTLSVRQLIALYNLLKSEVDWGEGLSDPLEALRQELRAKAQALGLVFREGYLYRR